MTYRSPVFLLLFAAVFNLAAPPVAAHHSFAMFDKDKVNRLEGVVSRFAWTNPHVFIELQVPDKEGNTLQYKIEAASTNMLLRQSWKVNSIKSGDRIKVAFNPLKNGLPGGLLTEVTLADGAVLKGV